jgi:aryl-alcohol dehydrogenase-like predicted oxidoreductase
MKDAGRRSLLQAMLAAATGLAARRLLASEERPSMLTRKIPSSGEPLPVVGVGTSGAFEVGEAPAERAPIEQVLETLVEGGAKVVDTSPMYGRAEGVVGDVATKLGLSAKLFLATKVWTTGRAEGIRQMEESFAKLKTKRIDLMQIHNLVDWRTQLATVRAWKAEGRIRYVGITHYRVDSHDELEAVMKEETLDFVQLNYSALTRDAEKRLLPLAADRGVAVLVNRPFEDGAIFSRVRGRALPRGRRRSDATPGRRSFSSTSSRIRRDVRHPGDRQGRSHEGRPRGGDGAASGCPPCVRRSSKPWRPPPSRGPFRHLGGRSTGPGPAGGRREGRADAISRTSSISRSRCRSRPGIRRGASSSSRRRAGSGS